MGDKSWQPIRMDLRETKPPQGAAWMVGPTGARSEDGGKGGGDLGMFGSHLYVFSSLGCNSRGNSL